MIMNSKNLISIIYISFSILLLLTGSINLRGERIPYKGNLKGVATKFEQKGDSLYLSLFIDASEIRVISNHSLDIVPILSDSTNSFVFPNISIKGRNNYMSYKRKEALNGDKDTSFVPYYKVFKGYGERSENRVELKSVIQYKPWMSGAILGLNKTVGGCRCVLLPNGKEAVTGAVFTSEKLPEPVIIPEYKIVPYVEYIRPESIQSEDIKLELKFASGKTAIDPGISRNSEEIAKLISKMESLKENNFEVTSINITGFASPDGPIAINKKVSESRARSLMNYLINTLSYPPSIFHIKFGGENWDGLAELLTESNLDYRDDIINIISTYDTETERENLIKRHKGGATYKHLMENIFPKLRISVCEIFFKSKNMTIEEISQILNSDPKRLTINDMYSLATSFPHDSKECIDILETAARIYPADDVANINASGAAILKGDIDGAESYLSKVRSKVRNPFYDNNMGIISAMKEEYDRARLLLESSLKGGIKSAEYNLLEIDKKENNLGK